MVPRIQESPQPQPNTGSPEDADATDSIPVLSSSCLREPVHPYSGCVYGRPVSAFLGVRSVIGSTLGSLFVAYLPVPISGRDNDKRWVCCGIFRTAEEAAQARDRAALGLVNRGDARQQLTLNYATRRYTTLDCFQTVFGLQLRHPDLVTMNQVGEAMSNAAAHGAQPPEDNMDIMDISSPGYDSEFEQPRGREGRGEDRDFIVGESSGSKRRPKKPMARPAGKRTSGDNSDDPLISLLAAATAAEEPGEGVKGQLQQRSDQNPWGGLTSKVMLFYSCWM